MEWQVLQTAAERGDSGVERWLRVCSAESSRVESHGKCTHRPHTGQPSLHTPTHADPSGTGSDGSANPETRDRPDCRPNPPRTRERTKTNRGRARLNFQRLLACNWPSAVLPFVCFRLDLPVNLPIVDISSCFER